MAEGSLFIRILEYRGLVARGQFADARARQAQLAKSGNARDLGTVLVAMGAITKAQLDEVVGGAAAKLRCRTCGHVPADQRVAPKGWPACEACNGRIDIAPGSSRLEAAKPGDPTRGLDPLAATLELGLTADDVATMKGGTPNLVVPVSDRPRPADPPPARPPQQFGGPLGPPRPPQPGDVLGGCRIERKLGQGGMGAVFLATHLMLDKPVAIKILDPRLMNSKEVIGRFQLEARAAAKLDHPNIVRVLNVGAEAGLYFMTQEFVSGESLMELLKRRGSLDPRTAAAIIREIARGLAAAHNEGVVHRDIKPGNVMMTAEGAVKIADFGLAKEMHSDAELSHSGQVLGSPHYLSPEQGAGRPVDHRTDLYALGVTYFLLLSGKRPFDGATPIAVIFKHINEAPPKVTKFAPETPPGHVAIVSKCLRKDPDDRYPDAETLIADLDAVIAGRSPNASEGKGGLSTVRDKPVPKPLTHRYSRAELESSAELTNHVPPDDRGRATSRRGAHGGGVGAGDHGARRTPGVLGKLMRFAMAMLFLAACGAGAFWMWQPAEAEAYWELAKSRTTDWMGLETGESRAAAALAHAEQVSATMEPGEASKAYDNVARQHPGTVAAVQATKRAAELLDTHVWAAAEGTALKLKEAGKYRESVASLEEFLRTRPGAKQSARANDLIESLNALLAADVVQREANAKAAWVPVAAQLQTAADPLHRDAFPALVRSMRDIATKYAGAATAAIAATQAETLQQARADEARASLQRLRRTVTSSRDPTTAFGAIEKACNGWLARFGDREAEAAQVTELLEGARATHRAAVDRQGWSEQLETLERLFAETPDAWSAIFTLAQRLKTTQSDPDIAAAAARIEKETRHRFESRANATWQRVRATSDALADAGDPLGARRALEPFDQELFDGTPAAQSVVERVARLTRAIEQQLTDPREWVTRSEAREVQRARQAAEVAAAHYARSSYAERAVAMRDEVVAEADGRAEAWIASAADLEPHDAPGALAAWAHAIAAGNAAQRTVATTRRLQLLGAIALDAIRTAVVERDWATAERQAGRVLADASLSAVHPTASALQRHAAALGDDMVYVAGALVPRAGGGQVSLPPFYIDRLEVSAAKFKQFVDARGYIDDQWWDTAVVSRDARTQHYLDRTGKVSPRYWIDAAPPPGLANHPVRNITWFEAQAYAKFRGKALPTGRQWLAAAGWDPRTAALTPYPWGPSWDTTKAYAGVDEGSAPTVVVDSLPEGASPAGCLHMAGNVREWTADWFDPFTKSERLVVGGGAYSLDAAAEARVTARHAKAPYNAGDDVGLRLVRPAPTQVELGLK